MTPHLRFLTAGRLTAAILVGGLVLSAAGLAWFAKYSPSSRFLWPAGEAKWIQYATPRQTAVTPLGPVWRTVFHRRFQSPGVPGPAILRIRVCSSFSIELNGQPVELPEPTHHNQEQAAEVGHTLRTGTNEIQITVANNLGPPMLWASLEGPGWSVVSDSNWSASLGGAAECGARVAGEALPPQRGNPTWGSYETSNAIQHRWPTLLIFALTSTGILLFVRWLSQRSNSLQLLGRSLTPLSAGLLTLAVAWVMLLGHDLLSGPLLPSGFDVSDHLAYIQYIQDHHTLPHADEGWEMSQPPLYYILAASVLTLCRLGAQDPGALIVLRLLGLAIGLGQLVLTAGCLRHFFPDQPRRQLAGLVVAGFLPLSICMCYYVTNDCLMLLTGTASAYVAMLVLRAEQVSLVRHACLGACLGAALLTKATAISMVATVFLVLIGQLLVGSRIRRGAGLLGMGLTLLVTILTSGWFYARTWQQYGTPLIGSFDARTGYHWWFDPAYASGGYLFGFGRAPDAPFFAAFDSLPDGLYSTLWGDGMCGGSASWGSRPPWNYELMAIGFVLAVVPSLACLVGFGWLVRELLRRPRAEWFLLLSVALSLVLAILYQIIRYPYCSHASARYALPGIMALAATGGIGLEVLSRCGQVVSGFLAVLVGTWALVAYSSYWIDAAAPETQNWAGLTEQLLNRDSRAENNFRKASEAAPHYLPSRMNRIWLLVQQSQLDKTRGLVEEVLREDPDQPEALAVKSLLAQDRGQLNEASALLRRACAVAPDYAAAHSLLALLLMGQGQDEQAITAFRQALRSRPADPGDHANLGLLLLRTGQTSEAIAQYRLALELRPAHPPWLADLAWILATQENDGFRDLPAALELAQHACELTQNGDPFALQSLAAAQAALGQFEPALASARRAAELAQRFRQTELFKQIQQQLKCYEGKKLFFARAPARTQPHAQIRARSVRE